MSFGGELAFDALYKIILYLQNEDQVQKMILLRVVGWGSIVTLSDLKYL